MKAVAAALAVVVAVVAIAVLAIGTWQLDWFVKEKDTNRQVHIDNRNTGTQTAWHDQVVSDIRDFNLLDESDHAHRAVLTEDACNLIGRLAGSYRDDQIVAFDEEHCS